MRAKQANALKASAQDVISEGESAINICYDDDGDCASMLRSQFDSGSNHHITIATGTPTPTNYTGDYFV